MSLIALNIQKVRRIFDVSLIPSADFNLFIGNNGSGKTSVLEAIHILGLGRSFRHHKIGSIIQYHQESLCVYGALKDSQGLTHQLGIEKKENKSLLRLNHQSVDNISLFAGLLPIQLIHSDSDELIMGSSKVRRQFIDWGVFHVEQCFYDCWKKYMLVLKQRNSALKMKASRKELSAWDEVFIPACEKLSQLREDYICQLSAYFEDILNVLNRIPKVRIEYRRGWPEKDLNSVLQENYYRDIALGYSCFGAHRDDLAVLCSQYTAASVLSRGEQKLTVLSLKLAQGLFLRASVQKSCIFLADDFGAELDAAHRLQAVNLFSQMNAQVFLTSIDFEEVKNAFGAVNPAIFNVEQGQITAYNHCP